MSAQKSGQIARDYIDFQSTAISPFHVVKKITSVLDRAGFLELRLGRPWQLKDQKYYVVHPDKKSVIAFTLGESDPYETGFAMTSAHTDSPALKLRLSPSSWNSAGTYQLQTEIHGGLILRSWLDRPLVVGGMVYQLHRKNGAIQYNNFHEPEMSSTLTQSSQPIGIIPELAIHLDPDKNRVGEINPEKILQVITSLGPEEDLGKQLPLLWEKLGIESDQVDSFDLYFAPNEEHRFVGLDESMIAGPRHDDLAMVFSTLDALVTVSKQPLPRTAVASFFDGEETGSRTCSAAQSSFLRDILERISNSMSTDFSFGNRPL